MIAIVSNGSERHRVGYFYFAAARDGQTADSLLLTSSRDRNITRKNASAAPPHRRLTGNQWQTKMVVPVSYRVRQTQTVFMHACWISSCCVLTGAKSFSFSEWKKKKRQFDISKKKSDHGACSRAQITRTAVQRNETVQTLYYSWRKRQNRNAGNGSTEVAKAIGLQESTLLLEIVSITKNNKYDRPSVRVSK